MSDENTVSLSSLDVFLKYFPGCSSSVESIAYCGGTDAASFPLLWYDPKTSVTDRWDTTGQIPAGAGASGMTGQSTTCDLINNEIQMTIDNNPNHKPNLLSDLNYTPFVIGYPFTITSFTAVSGIALVNLQWETSAENNIKGYFVVRALNQNGPYYRDSDLILSKGDKDIGGIYSYSDTGLDNGTTYWYKLEIIDANGISLGFNSPISVTTYSMVPTATDISPTSTLAGGVALSITVNGTNFLPASKVRWDGSDLGTSFISATKLTAVIPATLITYAGTHNITVFNPNPGGGTSTAVVFTVNNPVPSLTSILPVSISSGSASFSLTADGSNFVCVPSEPTKSSQVRWAGSSTNITITSCTSTRLIATIPASKVVTAGSYTVTVFNPTPGGGSSSNQTFTVLALTATKTATRTATTVYIYRSPTPIKTRTRTPTRTLTGTVFATPSATQKQSTPQATDATVPAYPAPETATPEPSLPGGTVTPTTTLAPGEPTYTPQPPSPDVEDQEKNINKWRWLTLLRVIAGTLAGIGLLSIPGFFIYHNKTKNKSIH